MVEAASTVDAVGLAAKDAVRTEALCVATYGYPRISTGDADVRNCALFAGRQSIAPMSCSTSSPRRCRTILPTQSRQMG